jgi:hypothetical protein
MMEFQGHGLTTYYTTKTIGFNAFSMRTAHESDADLPCRLKNLMQQSYVMRGAAFRCREAEFRRVAEFVIGLVVLVTLREADA